MTKVTGKDKDQMESISESTIQRVDDIESEEIENVEHNGGEDTDLEADLAKMEETITNDGIGDISKPKVTLRFRNARFTHLWDLNSTNENCLCEKKVTVPTEADLEKRVTYSNYTVSRCGCAYHSACIKKYVADLGVDQDMVNCPLCRTKYEPLPNRTPDTGVYQATN